MIINRRFFYPFSIVCNRFYCVQSYRITERHILFITFLGYWISYILCKLIRVYSLSFIYKTRVLFGHSTRIRSLKDLILERSRGNIPVKRKFFSEYDLQSWKRISNFKRVIIQVLQFFSYNVLEWESYASFFPIRVHDTIFKKLTYYYCVFSFSTT